MGLLGPALKPAVAPLCLWHQVRSLKHDSQGQWDLPSAFTSRDRGAPSPPCSSRIPLSIFLTPFSLPREPAPFLAWGLHSPFSDCKATLQSPPSL